MANLTQVLPGNRLPGAVTFAENYDPQSLSISLNDNQATADAEVFSAGVLVADAQTLSDLITALVRKALSDTQASSDSKVLAVAKALAETLDSSDSIIVATTKAFDDPLPLSEAVGKEVAKAFSESLGSADAKVKTVAKALNESLGMTEARAVAVAKTAVDIVTLAEAVGKSVETSFAETQASSDNTALNPNKALDEEITTSDALLPFLVNKGLADFMILQEWVSVKLIRANVWSFQANAIVTQTLYARPLFGQRLFAASPGIIWTKDNAKRRNWTNLDGENNQEA